LATYSQIQHSFGSGRCAEAFCITLTVQLKTASRVRHLLGIESDKIINTKNSWRELGRLKPSPVCEAGVIPQYVVGWAKEKATTILRMAAPTLVIYHNPRDFHKKVVASPRK